MNPHLIRQWGNIRQEPLFPAKIFKTQSIILNNLINLIWVPGIL